MVSQKLLFTILIIFLYSLIQCNLQLSKSAGFKKVENGKLNAASSIQYAGEREVERWEVDHFEPKPGKIFGIWTVITYTLDNLAKLKNHWGYSHLFVKHGEDYRNAIAAGYNPSHLMMDVRFSFGTNKYKDIISTYDAKYYYLGEAVNHSCDGSSVKRLYAPAEIKNILSYMRSHRPGSLLVSDGYKRCSHFDSLASIVDIIMYSSYKDWYQTVLPCITGMEWGQEVEFAWVPGGTDQRDSWSSMKLHYPNYSMVWINTKEGDEFDDLFQKANDLGIDAVWVYGFTENNGIPVPHYNDRFPELSNAAYEHGFLNKFVRKVRDFYKYIGHDSCSSTPPGRCWEFLRTELTDIVIEKN